MRAKFLQWQDRKYQGRRDPQELPAWKQAIVYVCRLQRGGEDGALHQHLIIILEDGEGKPLFMKAKYGNSIAKTEQRMNDLRKSKR
jgi:hypothetical protein